MKVIWLTGGSGSGKSTVSGIMAERGYRIIDTDRISKEILNVGTKAYDEVVNAFGTDILMPDKKVNRRMLGDIVFGDSKKLDILNGIMHKYITIEIEDSLKAGGDCIIDAPLPNTYGIACNMTVAVTAPQEMRIERIMKRDNISRKQAESRIASQISDKEYRALADAVIVNDGNMERLCENIDRILGV